LRNNGLKNCAITGSIVGIDCWYNIDKREDVGTQWGSLREEQEKPLSSNIMSACRQY
jgi:hypothetical protein